MASFILLLMISILGLMYVKRLIKYKFRDEKRPVWKIIHVIAFIIVYIPLLIFGYFALIDAGLREIGILVIAVFLYLIYKEYKKYKNYKLK